jgi:hypothetical protein
MLPATLDPALIGREQRAGRRWGAGRRWRGRGISEEKDVEGREKDERKLWMEER